MGLDDIIRALLTITRAGRRRPRIDIVLNIDYADLNREFKRQGNDHFPMNYRPNCDKTDDQSAV
jgi:hypothetical protein